MKSQRLFGICRKPALGVDSDDAGWSSPVSSRSSSSLITIWLWRRTLHVRSGIYRGVEQPGQLAWLITKRSQVQILPPLPRKMSVFMIGILRGYRVGLEPATVTAFAVTWSQVRGVSEAK